jgi:hypothetical protein
MLSKKRYNKMALTAVTVLLSALFISCVASKKAGNNNTEQTEEQKKDSGEQFIPTHPPVVIPHSWRDA